jgi:NOL1/NOP2/fmu family ribosome biogenesis protein
VWGTCEGEWKGGKEMRWEMGNDVRMDRELLNDLVELKWEGNWEGMSNVC